MHPIFKKSAENRGVKRNPDADTTNGSTSDVNDQTVVGDNKRMKTYHIESIVTLDQSSADVQKDESYNELAPAISQTSSTTEIIEKFTKNQIVKMEAKSILKREEERSIAPPLNYDCLLELFQWLGFKECMNFAEAYDGFQCVADWMYIRKFTNFTFDFEDPIDRVFYHIGPFVRSLTIVLDKFDYTGQHLKEIFGLCEQLQSLTLKGYNRRTITNHPFYGRNDNVEHVEVLTLNHCCLENDEDFFETFTNLKSLNIIRCREIDNIAMKKCFENNRLTSFVCNGSYRFHPHLLQLLPKLERLHLHYNTRLTSNVFSNFPELRFLTLHCWDENINHILAELAKNNTLEQLEIIDVRIDANTFNIINSFDKAELLVVTTDECEYTLVNVLPTKLKSLKLGGFRISQQQITSLTKQLPHLEDILLADCILENNGTLVNDFNAMADLMVEALNTQIQANRQLNVQLTHYGDNSNYKKIVATGRLRICNYLEASNGFQIFYPGMADKEM